MTSDRKPPEYALVLQVTDTKEKAALSTAGLHRGQIVRPLPPPTVDQNPTPVPSEATAEWRDEVGKLCHVDTGQKHASQPWDFLNASEPVF